MEGKLTDQGTAHTEADMNRIVANSLTALAGFTCPFKLGGDGSIVDAHGRTILIADPSRDLPDEQADDIAALALTALWAVRAA